VIEKVQAGFQCALQERALTFTTEGLDGLPILYADAALLQKVFYHVIVNAIKYTPDGGRITVSGRTIEDIAGGPQVEITVKDSGIGIDPQYQKLVFEKFYQTGEVHLHSSGKTNFKGGGPGLGLAIARGIVNTHSGRIWIESPGHDEQTCPGTTVHIRLPVNGWEDEDYTKNQ
jgi:signal transduction histidine kinase